MRLNTFLFLVSRSLRQTWRALIKKNSGTIDTVKVNGTNLAIADKAVNITVTEGTTNGTISVNGADVAFFGASDLFTKVATLIGTDASKSVRTIANEELAAQLIPSDAQESLDTLTEIAAWIQAHPADASAMNAAITALQNILAGIGGETDESKTVAAYVAAEIAKIGIGDYYKKSEIDTQFVAKEAGKSLVSDTDITKLQNVADGAQVNVIEAVKVDGVALTVTNKSVNIDLSNKVNVQDGYSLMSTAEHEKLASLVECTDADIDAMFATSSDANPEG